ncbi:hypothetical protein, partial [Sphingopyxis sp.]|uniref:hypothetical protein n=1 Tax=Sphingopyxis sp. TaxID=1908224 RepID=UPI0040372DF6
MDSGRINGGVDQGNGNDRFQISAGTVMTHVLRPWEGSASRLWVRGCQGRTRGDQSWASIFASMAVLVTPRSGSPTPPSPRGITQMALLG